MLKQVKKLVDYVSFYVTKFSFNIDAYAVFADPKWLTQDERNVALVRMNSSCEKLVGLAKRLGKTDDANADEFEDGLYLKVERRFPETD